METNEQKAKAYDAVLERAKDMYAHTGNGYAKQIMEQIFSELKENEDEMIRKAIYNALKYLETELSWDFLGNVDILDAYAWLEKQGEHKSNWSKDK